MRSKAYWRTWRARAHCMPVVPGVARAGLVTVVACNKLSAARVVAVLLEAEAVPAEGGTHVLAAAAVGIDHIEPAGAGLRIRLVVVQRVAFVASERAAGCRAVVATAFAARLKCRAAVGPSWWGRKCTARRIARVFARVVFRARPRHRKVAVVAGRWLQPAARGLTNARVARTAVVVVARALAVVLDARRRRGRRQRRAWGRTLTAAHHGDSVRVELGAERTIVGADVLPLGRAAVPGVEPQLANGVRGE